MQIYVYWKFKEILIVNQMVKPLHNSTNILYVCNYKNVLTRSQQKLHLLVNIE